MTSASPEQGRSYSPDLIRVVSIFLVVTLHVAAGLMNKWGRIPFPEWMTGNVYDSLSRISVPLLFMVSGSLLLAKQEPMKQFFIKRASKLLVPFLVWSLVYLVWYCRVDAQGTCSRSVVLRLLLLDGTYYHLWFLYTLIGLYLGVPLFRVITASGGRSMLWYFAALWLFFQPVLGALQYFGHIQVGISLPMATGYIGFFVLGYLLSETPLTSRRVPLLFIGWLAGAVVTIAGTYVLSQRQQQFSGLFYDNLSLNVILMSVCAFLLLRWLAAQGPFQHPRVMRLVARAAEASFGIDLIHALVLAIIVERIPFVQINVQMGNPAWSIPLVSVATFALSFLAVCILQRVPFIKHIVP